MCFLLFEYFEYKTKKKGVIIVLQITFFLFGNIWKEIMSNFGKIGLIEKKKNLK